MSDMGIEDKFVYNGYSMKIYIKLAALIVILFSTPCLVFADMVKRSHITPTYPEIYSARSSLPPHLDDGQCTIACLKDEIDTSRVMIAGYYIVTGDYENNICIPKKFTGDLSDKASRYSVKCRDLDNCHDGKCWANGETGEYYRKVHDVLR